MQSASALSECLAFVLSEPCPTAKLLPRLAELVEDPDLGLPCTLLFSLYNGFALHQPGLALAGLSKISSAHPRSLANVAGLVAASACYDSLGKYKQALEAAQEAISISEEQGVDREWGDFYAQALVGALRMHPFGAFRSDYLRLVDRALDRYPSILQSSEIMRTLQKIKTQLETKICSNKLKANLMTKMKSPKASRKLLLPSQQSESSEKSYRSSDKSASQSKRASYYSPGHRTRALALEQGMKKFVNPYGLAYDQAGTNECAFM